ncbi:hypothetical protein CIPAW_10G128200 [Carya illinoinensis]|uniref:Photosystem II cytochrome b559 N-terminal domain-containing protein n=1 Tax=Carya illinoinensis TaxID=32201 RepID=A0A8T1PFC6_CARIL|nr:hypothetical protein CIPAW_10G128200 [Carya illinoinensis]
MKSISLSFLLYMNMELNLIRSKGKCSFAYIIASIRYWVIHSITVPSIFIASWLFINMGLAYDITGIKASVEFSEFFGTTQASTRESKVFALRQAPHRAK